MTRDSGFLSKDAIDSNPVSAYSIFTPVPDNVTCNGGIAVAKEKVKSSKKAASKDKEGFPRKVGVIDTIVNTLKTGTSKKPVTKADILKALMKKFPDRDEKGMKSTINIQVPGRLSASKGFDIQKNDKGFWLSKDAVAAKPKKGKGAKPKAKKAQVEEEDVDNLEAEEAAADSDDSDEDDFE